jgi:hypothetical protein
VVTREGIEPQVRLRTLAVSGQPRVIRRQAVAPLHSDVPDRLKEYSPFSVIYATVGMVPETRGSQRVWAVVYIQEGSRMIQTDWELDDFAGGSLDAYF